MASDYARRDALAREQGFSGYGEKRRALELAQASNLFQRWAGDFEGTQSARNADYRRAVETYWRGFHDNPNDYSRTGGKARWFVEYEELMSYEEWEERYPDGVRTYLR